MKAYILSEGSPHGIALANIINSTNNTAIIGNPEAEGYSELIDEAVESLNSGYDFSVLISKKPIEASIAANRANKLRAVVCRSQADSARARRAKANLIILDDTEFSKTSAASIMRGWFGSSTESADEEQEPPEPRTSASGAGNSVLGVLNSGIGIIKGRNRQKIGIEHKKTDKEENKEGDEEEDTKRPKNGGIIGSIKYIFGIE